MAELVVRGAGEVAGHAAVRRVLGAHGAYLAANPAGAANICLEGYGQELEGLPGEYAVLLLAWVDGEAAGCVAMRTLPVGERACEMTRLWVEGAFRGWGL